MGEINKKPQVISDLVEIATYIGQNNLSTSDSFLLAAEETFRQLGNFPNIGKSCQFFHPKLIKIRQKPIKGFRKYLIFYCLTENGVEILRVIDGMRNIEAILQDYLDINDF